MKREKSLAECDISKSRAVCPFGQAACFVCYTINSKALESPLPRKDSGLWAGNTLYVRGNALHAFRRAKRDSLSSFLYFLVAKSTKNSGGPRRRHSAYGLAAAPPCSPHTSRVRKALVPPVRAALLSHLLTTVVSGVSAEASYCIAPTAYSKNLWPLFHMFVAMNTAHKYFAM